MPLNHAKERPIRIGVIGLSRGQSFISKANDVLNLKLVAICDTGKERLKETGGRLGVATHTDYDRFLEHDMDAGISTLRRKPWPTPIRCGAGPDMRGSETGPHRSTGDENGRHTVFEI